MLLYIHDGCPMKSIKTFHCAIHINISIYIFQCKATEGAWNSIASTACHTGSTLLLLTPHCARTCDRWRDQVLNIIGGVVSSIITVQCPHLPTLASAWWLTVMDRGSSVVTVDMFAFSSSYTQTPARAPAKYEVILKWDEKVMKSWGQETRSNSQLLVWRKL